MKAKRAYKHNLSEAEIRSIFTNYMRSQGLIIEGKDDPILMDGKTHYVPVANRSRAKRNAKSGWYCGHLGDYPAGSFGWLHGDKPQFKWSLIGYLKDQNMGRYEVVELSPEEAEQRLIQEQREKARKLRQQKEELDFAIAITTIEWYRSLPLNMHPYLQKKGFSIEECSPHTRIYNQSNFTRSEIEIILKEHFPEYNKPRLLNKLLNYQEEHIRYRGYNLIHRGQLIDGRTPLHQLIFDKKSKADKDKHFPTLTIKRGTFLNLGTQIDHENPPDYVIICEGWATGISLVRMTLGKIPVLVAWDSGNMRAVAIAIRKKFRKCKIYSANDNDHTKEPSKNAGLVGGLKVGYAVGAYMLNPPFDPNNPSHKDLSDWNDFDNTHPPAITGQIFRDVFIHAEYIDAEYNPDYCLITNERFKSNEEFPVLLNTPAQQYKLISLYSLILQGLQNCEYTQEEILKAWEDEELKYRSLYPDIAENPRIYDLNIDLKLSDIYQRFTRKILNSGNNIIFDYAIFKELLDQLKPLQDIVQKNSLLNPIFNLLEKEFGTDMAEACFSIQLSNANYFDRSQSEWHLELCKKLKSVCSEIKPEIAIPLVIKSHEVSYWYIPRRTARETLAAEKIYQEYNAIVNEFEDDIISIENQYRKIKIIWSHIHGHMLSPSEKQYEFINRMVQKFNQTEPNQLNIYKLLKPDT